MWSKQQAVAEPPAVSPSAAASTPVVGFNQPSTGKPSSAPARGGARLGASIQIRGEVTGSEDLQIDGIVEGPIRIKGDRKSTRLNSSHPSISYAVFCLKKKKITKDE